MESSKKTKFGLGFFLGSIIGGLTALFFSPKSGKENREEAKKLYQKAKTWLEAELKTLKKGIDKIDKESYKKAVDRVVKKIAKEAKKGAKEIKKVKEQLIKDWEKTKVIKDKK